MQCNIMHILYGIHDVNTNADPCLLSSLRIKKWPSLVSSVILISKPPWLAALVSFII